MQNNRLVIGSTYGGLGDHLFLTPLPRLFKESNPESSVFLSSQSKYRGDQTKDFVWANNPYIDGIIDEPIDKRLLFGKKSYLSNFIMNRIAENLGLQYQQALKPEIYRNIVPTSDQIEKLSGSILIDFNYISYVGAFRLKDALDIISNLCNQKIFLINPNISLIKKIKDVPFVKSKDLFDYASLIMASRKFACLPSGSAALAAALNKDTEVYYGHGMSECFLHPCHNNQMIGSKSILRKIYGRVLKTKNSLVRKIKP